MLLDGRVSKFDKRSASLHLLKFNDKLVVAVAHLLPTIERCRPERVGARTPLTDNFHRGKFHRFFVAVVAGRESEPHH